MNWICYLGWQLNPTAEYHKNKSCSMNFTAVNICNVLQTTNKDIFQSLIIIDLIMSEVIWPPFSFSLFYPPLSLCIFSDIPRSSVGAHLNPAVTLSFCILGQVQWVRLVPYCLSQILGAYVASALVYLVYYGLTFYYFPFNKSLHSFCPVWNSGNRDRNVLTALIKYLGSSKLK